MDEKITLTKVNIVGNKWVHRYINLITGELLEVECTEEEYRNIKDNGVKEIAGYKWDYSIERPKYDTQFGDLENNQYADYVKTGRYIVKVGSKVECEIDKKEIVLSVLSTIAFEEIQKGREDSIISAKEIL